MTLDARTLSASLHISQAAAELYLTSDVVDLHLDTFIWTRVFGYDLTKRHGTGLLNARIWGQADLPRVLDSGLTGAMWVITTNPLRTRKGRRDTLLENLAELRGMLERDDRARLVSSVSEYRAARAEGKHAAFVGLQGGNALSYDLSDFDRPECSVLTRITLMHFTRSRLGAPALPRALSWGPQGLTDYGVEYVHKCNHKRILVDLAHSSPACFWQVMDVHDRKLPLAVTHGGCMAVHEHFRNLTDAQLRAVAATGGVVGIMFQSGFLGEPTLGGRAEAVVRHLEHVVRTVGEDHAALGSDFDGAIMPPRDLKSVLELPRLVELMLQRGFAESTIRKILGGNALRVLGALRP
jgi:membrane dipeptidase